MHAYQPTGVQSYQNSQYVVPVQQRIVYQKPGDTNFDQNESTGQVGKREEKESHYSKHMSSKASFGMSHRQNQNQVISQENEADINQMNDD